MIDALPSDIFRQGQVLNNTYEIEGVLGRGGTGEVYRARNQISGRIVAIKALNSQFSGNEDYVELMKREEEMRDIRNDAVVRYTECSRTDQGHVFLVMDFIDGPSMSDIMHDRRMDPRELMIVAHRVAEGLVAAHGNGIVHRDLSPDNVVLQGGSPEKATIIDFGIAKDTASGARTIVGNDFAGKYEYAAPEQLEGKAEPRSDLYALGALLLASYRGAVPFPGATPGEIVRRKQSPLDTESVPEPLKGLIDWLSQPVIAKRPNDAQAVVDRLSQALPPATQRGKRTVPPVSRGTKPAAPAREKKRGGGWLILPVVVIAVGAGLYFSGLLDGMIAPKLPVAAPYVLNAQLEDGGAATLSGNAPDQAAAARIVQAFAEATKLPEPAPSPLKLAAGLPSESWPDGVVSGLGAVSGLEGWTLALSDTSATVSGIAADAAARSQAEAALKDWATSAGFTLKLSLKTGPVLLSVEHVATALAPFETCGRLTQPKAAGESYALGDTIGITGAMLSSDDGATLQNALETAVGDRKVRLDVTVLNDDLCTIRRVLPTLPNDALSIWLGYGDTGQPNLSGIYHVNENPIVEVQAPAGVTGSSLWVVIVDNTGKVFNVLPNINQTEHGIDSIGIIEGGVRRVRVLHSIAEFSANNAMIAMKVLPTDFGKSEVIAILSKRDLFSIRRPRDESVESFAEALDEIVKQEPGNILAIASRLLDSRP